MTYSVHQHWDPLKVCIVGRSYNPEFYSFIKNDSVRVVLERIARETEEDYQKLIKLLEGFGVKVLRPNVSDDYRRYIRNGKIEPPPMTPRDYSAMIGNNFYYDGFDVDQYIKNSWDTLKGSDWPTVCPTNLEELSDSVLQELENFKIYRGDGYSGMLNQIKDHANIITGQHVNAAMTTRIGRDLYFGTESYDQNQLSLLETRKQQFPDYRCHVVNSGGHSDGTFCPVVPGLIVSLCDIPSYKDTFPDWEVVYLPGQSWDQVQPFLNLKEKNKGKWWVPGEELNDDFTTFVDSWLGHWVGYVEETVFDVNMLVIDEKNVVCNNYNEQVFNAFSRYSITPHVINFRHRYFWDGGLHCITSDLHREGILKDYFPERS